MGLGLALSLSFWGPQARAEPAGGARQAPWRASFCTQQQNTILLDYRGPLREYRGPISYGFAGYSETCIHAESKWLTPATRLRLPGPGQVPRDLLAGYTLVVRLPGEGYWTVPMTPGRCASADRPRA